MSKYKTESKTISIDYLQPNTWNPNKMDKKTYQAEKESIEQYGVIAPIIVRPFQEGFEVVDGEHRLNVCYDLGYKEIPCIIVHNLENKDAKKLTIILNETKGQNDKIELGKLLDDLEDLIDFGNVDWDKYETNIEPKDSDDQVLKLHLLFKGDDIPLVKDTLGDNPEQKILELIKNSE